MRYRYIDFIDALLIRGRLQKRERAFTLIELLLAAAIPHLPLMKKNQKLLK
jgi:hypothetical protein